MEGDNWQENNNSDNSQGLEITVDKRSTREKVISGVVLVVVFLAVFVGYYQMMSSLNGPLISIDSTKPQEEICYGGNCADNQVLLALERQSKDTDNDGLNDYDELNIYGTSPYLEDSDGDGILDGIEIEAGKDPNCAGNSCINYTETEGGIASVPILTTEPNQTQINLTVDEIRDLFVQSGVPVDKVKELTDEDVLALYGLALTEAGLNDQITATLPESVGEVDLNGLEINSIEDLKSLTGSQIRQLMIEQGAPTEILSQINDEDLRKIFIEKLTEQIE